MSYLNPANKIHIKPSSGWEFPDLTEVWRLRRLIYTMISSSLKGKYRQSLLSSFYLFIQPLFSVGIFTFIFSGIAKINTGDIPYPLYTLIGVTTWGFFSRSLNEGNVSLVSMGPVLSKVYFPRLIVVLVGIISQLLEYIIAFCLVFFFLFYYSLVPDFKIFLLPVAVIAIALFSLSLILWLSNLNVRFRDISMLLPGAIQIAFYATPVVYPLSLVPENWVWLFKLNPMTNILEFVRYCIFQNYPFPEVKYLIINGVTILVLLVFGLVIFNKYSKTMVDKL